MNNEEKSINFRLKASELLAKTQGNFVKTKVEIRNESAERIASVSVEVKSSYA